MEDISVSVDTTNHVETEHGFVTDSFIGTVSLEFFIFI